MENVKGFNDISGEEALKRERIKEIIVGTFKNYGFEPAETPVIEYEEFVKQGNVDDEVISDIFKLQDKGRRNLALRYELTFQLARLAKNKKLPYKRYQIGEVFRDEPVSANRFRQFVQCDADIIGSTIKDEAEILALTSEILGKLGVKAAININNRKLLNEILEKEGIKNKKEIIKELDKLDKLSEKQVKTNLKKYKAERLIDLFKKSEAYFKKFEGYKEIEELRKYCSFYNIKVKFQPSLARGLSYYTGNVFEIKTAGMKESLFGGGTFFVNGIQATGISFGLERLAKLARIKVEETRILIIPIGNAAENRKAIKIAAKLREKNISIVLWTDKGISKALEYANSLKIPYAVFIGKREISEGRLKLRNMQSGKEKMLSEKDLIKELARANKI